MKTQPHITAALIIVENHETQASYTGHLETTSHRPGLRRQSVTATESFPTATVPLIVIVAPLLWIVGRHLTPYLVRHSEKPNESFSGSQNDSSEQSKSAESESSFEPR